MKKFTVSTFALLTCISAFAYHDSDRTISNIYLFITIASIVVSIIIFKRWWNMTKDIKDIKKHLTHSSTDNPRLTFLIAIGEKEEAQKVAVSMLVDILMKIYYDRMTVNKAATMNTAINDLLPKMTKLGLSLPDHVTSGEKFIEYINNITGNSVKYVQPINPGPTIDNK